MASTEKITLILQVVTCISAFHTYLDSFLVNGSGIRDSIDFSCSLDVDIEHVMSLRSIYGLRCSFIDSHGVSRQSIPLLQFSIQQVNGWKARHSATFNYSTFYKAKIETMRNVLYTSCQCNSNKKVLTLGKLSWAAIQSLFKQISCSLQLLAPITINELGEVSVPDVINIWPPEESDATLICLKRYRKRE